MEAELNFLGLLKAENLPFYQIDSSIKTLGLHKSFIIYFFQYATDRVLINSQFLKRSKLVLISK